MGMSRVFLVFGLLSFFMSYNVYAEKPAGLSPQSLTTPNGPTSLKGLGESFSPNIAQGTGSYNVPLIVPPGFLAPDIALAYNSGSGKSEIGMGFKLPSFFIYRTTDKGLPSFNEDDRFAVSGAQFNDELVLVNASQRYYRLKNEGAYALFIRDVGNNSWEVRHANGETTYLGESNTSRQFTGQGAYRWYAARHTDRFDHEAVHHYFEDDGHLYISAITYQLHAPVDYQNKVSFSYESRPDPYTDYTYGAADTTNQRLSMIRMYHGERVMRTYSLSYQNDELYSLLSSVTLEGEEGLSLPTLSFEYAQHSSQGRPLVTMNSAPNTDGLLNGRATLDDVNGDGLPDILYGDANDYRYYENLDGYTWSQIAISLNGSPDKSLQDGETLLADINGDGFRDVVYKYGDQFRFYPAGEIVEGQFLGFESSETLTTYGTPNYHWGLNTVKISDLNKDGRTDMLYQPSLDSLKQIINGKENVLQEDNLSSLPLDISFTDPKISMTDFNGDGHLDFVKKDINYSSSSSGSRIRVWFGLGWGEYLPEQEMAFVPTGDPNEYHLQDVNKDGQADLIRISGSWVTYYLNTGRMSFTSAKGDFYGNPTSGQSQTILFGDMNGNTTTDVVWVMNDGKIKYLDMMIAPYMGLLTKVDNGMGAVTTMNYKSSTEYMIEAKNEGRPWRTPLRTPVQVLQSLEVTDSLDVIGLEPNIKVAEYVYRDGYYDGKEREFRGFAQATTIEHGDTYQETKITNSWMHVGRNLDTGADEEMLKGKAYLANITDVEGALIQSSEAAFEQRWLCAEDDVSVSEILPSCAFVTDRSEQKDDMVAMAVPLWTLVGHWEKSSSPKWVLETFEHDIWGGMTQKSNFGEVLFDNPDRQLLDAFELGDVNVAFGDDEVITKEFFIYNIEEWLLGQSYANQTFNLAGEMRSHTQKFYDGAPFVGLPLGEMTKGLATRETVWIKDNTDERWADMFKRAFNSDGKMSEVMDANNNRESLQYDTETGFFVVADIKELENDSLVYEVTYDKGYGLVNSSTNYNGYQREYLIDGLGRLSAWLEPEDTFSQPTRQYTYTYGTPEYPISTTLIEDLDDREMGQYVEKWLFSDGHGIKRLEKSQADGLSGYVASNWIRLGARGLKTHSYHPFFSENADFEAPPTDYNRMNVIYVDALDRTKRNYRPQLTSQPVYQATQFYPLETHVYNDRDTAEGTWSFPAVIKRDGLNRVTQIKNYVGEEGAIDVLNWDFEYNTSGKITSWRDPEGNTRGFTYDSRDKMLSAEDPNVGYYEFVYDDIGNEIQKIDDLGQIIQKTYGKANRIQSIGIRNQANGDPDGYFNYFYDTPSSGMPEATNTKGLLSHIEGPVNTRHFSYGPTGQINKERHDIWDGRSPFENQTRLSYEHEIEFTPRGFIKHRELPYDVIIDYTYNSRQSPKTVQITHGEESHMLLQDAHYDLDGNFTFRQYGNGTVTCRSFDARGNISNIRSGLGDIDSCNSANQFDTDAFFNVKTERNTEGFIAAIEDLSPVVPHIPRLDATYEYDRLSQLIQVSTPYDVTTFDYDRLQNLTDRNVFSASQGTETNHFEYGEGGASPNQMTHDGKTALSYDATGHLEQLNGFELLFDARGRLSNAVNSQKGQITNYYDHLGELIIHKVEPFLGESLVDLHIFDAFTIKNGNKTYAVEGGGQIAEVTLGRSPNPNLKLLDELITYHEEGDSFRKPLPQEWLDFNSDDTFDLQDLENHLQKFWNESSSDTQNERLVIKYLHPDLLGNASYITDTTGKLIHHEVYFPFGQLRSSHGLSSLKGFGGSRVEDNLGLGAVAIGARFYSKDHARWLSPDPLYVFQPFEVAGDVLQSNPYVYVSNNPILYIDKDGFWKLTVEAGLGAGVEGGGCKVDMYALLGFSYDSQSSASSSFSLTGRAGMDVEFGWFSYSKEVGFSVPVDLSGFYGGETETTFKGGVGATTKWGGSLKVGGEIKLQGLSAKQKTEKLLTAVGGLSLSPPPLKLGIATVKAGLAVNEKGDLTITAGVDILIPTPVGVPIPARVEISLTFTAEEIAAGAETVAAVLEGAINQSVNVTVEAQKQSGATHGTAKEKAYTSQGRYICFMAGTQISMADNSFKNIEDVEIGDLVWAWNETSKKLSAQRVSKTFIHDHDGDLVLLEDSIYVTPNHPVYVQGKWKPAGNLEQGDLVLTIEISEEGHALFEKRIESPENAGNHSGHVYNIEVENLHNYFADGVLVHNK